MSDHPVTRWEQADHSGYGQLFAQLVADGTDVDGEARLADVLVPRRCDGPRRWLGHGPCRRRAGAPRTRGHRGREGPRPGCPVAVDVPGRRRRAVRPARADAGIFWRPEGAGYYPAGAFVADVEAAGLVVDARFDSYDMRTSVDADYGVWCSALELGPQHRHPQREPVGAVGRARHLDGDVAGERAPGDAQHRGALGDPEQLGLLGSRTSRRRRSPRPRSASGRGAGARRRGSPAAAGRGTSARCCRRGRRPRRTSGCRRRAAAAASARPCRPPRSRARGRRRGRRTPSARAACGSRASCRGGPSPRCSWRAAPARRSWRGRRTCRGRGPARADPRRPARRGPGARSSGRRRSAGRARARTGPGCRAPRPGSARTYSRTWTCLCTVGPRGQASPRHPSHLPRSPPTSAVTVRYTPLGGDSRADRLLGGDGPEHVEACGPAGREHRGDDTHDRAGQHERGSCTAGTGSPRAPRRAARPSAPRRTPAPSRRRAAHRARRSRSPPAGSSGAAGRGRARSPAAARPRGSAR